MNDSAIKFKIAIQVKKILQALGVDIEGANFIGTPERVARAYLEFTEGERDLESKLEELFSKKFPSEYDGIVIKKDTLTKSLCPHHLIVVEHEINFGIIYKDYALGLSKIPRALKLISKRLILQEDLTEEILNQFERRLDPRGMICIIKSKHHCMRSRGIQDQGEVITSAVRGIFDEDLGARKEFFSLIR